MTRHELTIDLEDRLLELTDAISEMGEEAARLEAEFNDAKAAWDGDSDPLVEEFEDTDEYAELNQAFRQAKETEQRLVHAKEQIEAAIEEWGGSEFRIKKAQWGEMCQINDLTVADTLADDDAAEDPRTKLHARELRAVQVCTTSTPPDAPESPRDWPTPVGSFVHGKIDNLNDFGEVSMDDFSLSAAARGDESQAN